MFRKAIAMLLCLLMAVAILPVESMTARAAVFAEGYCGNNLKWTYDNYDGTLNISGTGAMWDFDYYDIPWYHYTEYIIDINISNGVTSIGDYAFAYCELLESIKLPNSITRIGDSAFGWCWNLKSITLPESLESIGETAFYNCDELQSINIPKKTSYIGEGAFLFTYDMTSINVDALNSVYCSINGVLYDKSVTKLIWCPGGKKSIDIPESVKYICESALTDCSDMTSVTIPDGVISIGDGAFYACFDLVSIYIPKSVTSIGTEAFLYCESLVIYYAGTKSEWNMIDVDYDCTLEDATIYYNCSNDVTRLAGTSRCDTAVEISQGSYNKATNVILANGDNYADALAGVSLAYALKGPILLVRNSTLDNNTLAEIQRLGAKNVYILGGTTAIKDSVATTLRNKGLTVERIYGYSRFDTAVAIAEKLQSVTGKKPTEVFMANAYNYPDALAVSSVAAVMGCPVLYIMSNGTLDSSTQQYLSTCGAGKATILGGTLAISSQAENNIKRAGISTTNRLYGASRYDTCIAINRAYSSVLTGNAVCIATGTNFPDALAGGVYAAVNKSPMVLVGTSLNNTQRNYLSGRTIDRAYIFGGSGVVPALIENELRGM